jgi:hypothetical protein
MASWKEQSGKAIYQWLGEPQISMVRLIVFIPAVIAVVAAWNWMCLPPNNIGRIFLFWLALVIAASSLSRRPIKNGVWAVMRLGIFAAVIVAYELIRRNL